MNDDGNGSDDDDVEVVPHQHVHLNNPGSIFPDDTTSSKSCCSLLSSIMAHAHNNFYAAVPGAGTYGTLAGEQTHLFGSLLSLVSLISSKPSLN